MREILPSQTILKIPQLNYKGKLHVGGASNCELKIKISLIKVGNNIDKIRAEQKRLKAKVDLSELNIRQRKAIEYIKKW